MIGRLTPSRVRVCVVFTRTLFRLYKNSGKPGLVRFLKSSQVILMQSIGASVLKDMTPLGCRVSRTSGGLPRCIPSLDRQKIRERDVFVIRFWMSLFSLYRVLEIKSVVKLSTITDPPKPFDLSQFKMTIEGFSRGFGINIDLKDPYFFPIYSASSTQFFEQCKPSTSFRGIVNGLISVLQNEDLLQAFSKWCPEPFMNIMKTGFVLFVNDKRFQDQGFWSGALAFLPEPAGKMRTIAMVDC